MMVLVTGFLVFIGGVLFIRFPELIVVLRKKDNHQWVLLGSPPAYAFSKTLGVYFWLLEKGYEKSPSQDVQKVGAIAHRQALFSKYACIVGAVLITAGFYVALF